MTRASRIATMNLASLPAFGPLAALSPALLPEGERSEGGEAGSVESPPERGGSWKGLMHQRRGFTLIELLIALALFSIMSLLAWRALDTVLQSRAAVETPGRAALQLAAAWTQLETDLQAARSARLMVSSAATSVAAPHIVASAQQLTLLRAPAQCAGCWEGVVYDIAQRDGETMLRRRSSGLFATSEAAQVALTALAQSSTGGQHVLLRSAASIRIAAWRESPEGLGAWLPLGAASASIFPAAPATPAPPALPQGREKNALKVEWLLGAPWDGWVSKVVILENRW